PTADGTVSSPGTAYTPASRAGSATRRRAWAENAPEIARDGMENVRKEPRRRFTTQGLPASGQQPGDAAMSAKDEARKRSNECTRWASRGMSVRLARAKVAAGARARIDNLNLIDQGAATLCGLACVHVPSRPFWLKRI